MTEISKCDLIASDVFLLGEDVFVAFELAGEICLLLGCDGIVLLLSKAG